MRERGGGEKNVTNILRPYKVSIKKKTNIYLLYI